MDGSCRLYASNFSLNQYKMLLETETQACKIAQFRFFAVPRCLCTWSNNLDIFPECPFSKFHDKILNCPIREKRQERRKPEIYTYRIADRLIQVSGNKKNSHHYAIGTHSAFFLHIQFGMFLICYTVRSRATATLLQ